MASIYSLDFIKNLVESRGGTLYHTTEIKTHLDKMEVSCSKGHHWNVTFRSLYYAKSWCAMCAGHRREKLDSLAELKKMVEARGGYLISDTFINQKTKYKAICSKNHEFETTFGLLKQNKWCAKCSPRYIENPLQEIADMAASRGGELLSDKYINSNTKLLFKCSNNHEFKMHRTSAFKAGKWCPICSSGLSERICRLWFETIFNVKFEKTRDLPFLKLGGQVNIELDGYNKDLNIAFEFNGEQHYNNDKLFPLAKYDEIKKKLCLENNIKLFVIPFTSKKDIKSEILKQSKILNIDLPHNFDEIQVDENKAYNNTSEIDRMNKLKISLEKRNYSLISPSWLGSTFKYKIQCINCKLIKNCRYDHSLVIKKCSCIEDDNAFHQNEKLLCSDLL